MTLPDGELEVRGTAFQVEARGGRTVGVISHLEELRLRIPTRLEVLSGRHGSRLAG